MKKPKVKPPKNKTIERGIKAIIDLYSFDFNAGFKK